MVHTFELLNQITLSEARLLDEKLTAFFNAKSIFEPEGNIKVYGRYSKIPFKLGIRTIDAKGGIFKYLVLTINPMKVMKKDYINVSSVDSACEALDKVKRILYDMGIGELFPMLLLNRIDYAFDVHFKSQEEVELYVKLMKRGDIPSRFKVKTWWDNVSHRQTTYIDSVYMQNSSATINFYNKYNELACKASDFIDCEKARGILRLEVQCKGRKVQDLKKNYKFDARTPTNYLEEQIARRVVTSCLKGIVREGDYYKLRTAKEIILNSDIQNKYKGEIIAFITEVNDVRSLYKVKMSGKYSNTDFNRILRQLSSINVNPVTIPSSWSYAYLPNLLTLI